MNKKLSKTTVLFAFVFYALVWWLIPEARLAAIIGLVIFGPIGYALAKHFKGNINVGFLMGAIGNLIGIVIYFVYLLVSNTKK